MILPLFSAKQVIIVNAMEKSSLEVRAEHIEKVVDDIQRDVKALDTRTVRMEALMEGVSRRVVSVEQKAEKTENRLWLIVIAVIVAGGIPALVTRILS